jgi:hypothetical protein
MQTFRVFNDVTEVPALFQVLGSRVSQPTAYSFLATVAVVFLGAVVFAQTGSPVLLIAAGVIGFVWMTFLLILDARLRRYKLRSVTLQMRLIGKAARRPHSRNY